MSVYSTLLFSGEVTSAPVALYTVPASTVVMVRDIEAFNGAASAQSLFIDRYVSGSLVSILFAVPSFAANTWQQWTGRAVMNAGDVLEAGGTASAMYLHISGYVLS